MRREKEKTPAKMRVSAMFKDMKVHSDDIRDFKVDSEPSNRMMSDVDAPNKADRDLKNLLENNAMPNRRNAGLKKQENRRYR